MAQESPGQWPRERVGRAAAKAQDKGWLEGQRGAHVLPSLGSGGPSWPPEEHQLRVRGQQ